MPHPLGPLPALQFCHTATPPTPETWSLLTPGEQARAAQFHFAHHRDRWIVGRAWLKRQLAAALHTPPPSLALSASPTGRPFLPDFPELDFNLSHSGDWIALALSHHARLGLDLEVVDPTFPARETAATCFLPSEQAWIASGPPERFFLLWTAKEALMKACGRGLSLPPLHLLVATIGDQPSSITNLEDGSTHPVHSRPGPGGSVSALVLLPRSP